MTPAAIPSIGSPRIYHYDYTRPSVANENRKQFLCSSYETPLVVQNCNVYVNEYRYLFGFLSLFHHWIVPYRIFDLLLTDTSLRFVNTLSATLRKFLEVKRMTDTAYCPQTNGKVQRYSKTIVGREWCYVSEHQVSWSTVCLSNR